MPSGNASRASWPSDPGPGAAPPELQPQRLRDGALEPDAGPLGGVRPGHDHRALVHRVGEAGHDQDAVDEPRFGQVVGETGGADLAQRGAVDRREHQRLVRRAALEHARELEQRRGVRRAARGVGNARRVAGGDHHDLAPRLAGAPADHVHQLLAIGLEAVDPDGEPALRERRAHVGPGGAVARLARAPIAPPRRRSGAPRSRRAGRRRGRRRRAPAAGVAAGSRARTSPARPRAARAGRPPDRSGARSRAQVPHTGNLQSAAGVLRRGHGRSGTPHPPGRRRAVGPEAARLSAAQGGLRGRLGPRRPGGARPGARRLVRPGRARPDAAQGRRLRGLPPDPRHEPGADHHAHREGRGDRQGARPRAGRRRLHHQAVLGPRVPQPREGRAAPRRARPLGRRSARSRSRTASC